MACCGTLLTSLCLLFYSLAHWTEAILSAFIKLRRWGYVSAGAWSSLGCVQRGGLLDQQVICYDSHLCMIYGETLTQLCMQFTS